MVLNAPSRVVVLHGTGFTSATRAKWKGAEHAITLNGATEVVVELDAGDVTQEGVLEITAINPPPGGGTSNPVQLPVGYPAPAVVSLSPASITIGQFPTLTVMGTGFVSESVVFWNDVTLTTHFISDTELRADIPDSLILKGVSAKVHVYNRGPAGGTSGLVDLPIVVPAPAITELQPTSAYVGVGFTLGVVGTGFTPASVIRVNGVARATEFGGTGYLHTSITASEFPSPATVPVEVFTPSPGGGLSPAAMVVVKYPPATISNVYSRSVIAGSPAFTITVLGSNFLPASTVFWNDEPRPTQYVSPAVVRASIPASDVASPGTAALTVRHFGDASAPFTFSSLTEPPIGTPFYIALPNNAVVYDHVRDVVYAASSASTGAFGKALVRVSEYGAIDPPLPLGFVPGKMAITADGAYLYVAAATEPKVARVDLASFSRDLEFTVGSGDNGPLFPLDLQTLSNQPRWIVVSRSDAPGSSHNSTAVFQDGVMLPVVTRREDRAVRLTGSADAAHLYAFDNEALPGDVRRLVVAVDGIRVEAVFPRLVNFNADFEFETGRLFFTSGDVFDVATMTKVGMIPVPGSVLPSPGSGRVLYMTEGVIRGYDVNTLGPAGPPVSAFCCTSNVSLAHFGPDGIAIGGENVIARIRSSLFFW